MEEGQDAVVWISERSIAKRTYLPRDPPKRRKGPNRKKKKKKNHMQLLGPGPRQHDDKGGDTSGGGVIPQEGRLGSGRGNRIRPREDSGPAEGGLGSGRGKTRVRPRESGPAEGRLGSDRGNRGQEPLPGGGPGARAAAGGTGGQSRCREDRGARAAAGRTGGKRRSWNGGRSRAHAVSRAVSETKQTNTKVLTLYEVHLPTQTYHTPRGVFRGPEATAEGTGGRSHGREDWGPKPQPRAAGQ